MSLKYWLVGFALIHSSQVHATPPGCETGDSFRSFTTGISEQTSYLSNLWSRYNCDKVQGYLDAIEVDYKKSGSTLARCYNAGAAEALYDQLSYLSAACSSQCAASGETLGRLHAETYCEAGALYPARTLPVKTIPVCTAAQLGACRERFNGIVGSACPNLVNTTGFRWALDSGCRLPT